MNLRKKFIKTIKVMFISLLVLTTLVPLNISANEASESKDNDLGDAPITGRVIVNYHASHPDKQLEQLVLEDEVGLPYKIVIKDFEGYTFTEVAPPDGGHAQIEGVYEEQDQHAYIFYESNTFSTIELNLSIQDSQNIKGHRPDTYTYSIFRIDPSTGEETLFHTETLDVTDVSENNLHINKKIEGEFPRFNDEGKKYEYRLETQKMSYFKNIDSILDFNTWTNEMEVTITEEDIADTVDIYIHKRFGSGMDTRRRMMNSPEAKVIPPVPEFVTVHVKRDGVDIAGSPVKLNKDNYWQTSFKDLPNIDASGNEIEYVISEADLEGFISKVEVKSDYTNLYENKRELEYGIVNTYVVDVTATKLWVNAPTVKPDVTFQLHELSSEYDPELGKEVDIETPIGDPVVLKDGTTSYTWKNLEKYLYSWGGAVEKVYTVKEINIPKGYDVEYSDDRLTVTNTFTKAPTIDIPIEKVWEDNNNAKGLRPSAVTINLLANGTEVDSAIIDATTGWKHTFNDMPEYKEGQPITYTITEEAVEHYTSKVEGFKVTNTYTEAPLINIPVEKVWDDNNDKEGLRPSTVTINLLANGEKVDSITIGKDQDWKHVFVDKPKDEGGQPIEYTITEEDVDFYLADVSGFKITNTRIATKIDIPVEKVWEDNNNAKGLRPSAVTINLLANGTEVDSAIIDATTGWKHTFNDMPEYKEGQPITYTITEEAVEHYTSKVEGFKVTNTLIEITKIDILVEKIWDDNNDAKGLRPSTITINLFANGEKIDSVTIGKDKDWKHVFVDLNEFKDNTLIEYTITEDEVDGYTTSIDRFKVTNKLKEDPVIPVDPPVDPVDPPVEPIDPPVDPVDPPVNPVDPPVEPGNPELPGTGISSSLLPQIAIGLGFVVLMLNKALKRKTYKGQ